MKNSVIIIIGLAFCFFVGCGATNVTPKANITSTTSTVDNYPVVGLLRDSSNCIVENDNFVFYTTDNGRIVKFDKSDNTKSVIITEVGDVRCLTLYNETLMYIVDNYDSSAEQILCINFDGSNRHVFFQNPGIKNERRITSYSLVSNKIYIETNNFGALFSLHDNASEPLYIFNNIIWAIKDDCIYYSNNKDKVSTQTEVKRIWCLNAYTNTRELLNFNDHKATGLYVNAMGIFFETNSDDEIVMHKYGEEQSVLFKKPEYFIDADCIYRDAWYFLIEPLKKNKYEASSQSSMWKYDFKNKSFNKLFDVNRKLYSHEMQVINRKIYLHDLDSDKIISYNIS